MSSCRGGCSCDSNCSCGSRCKCEKKIFHETSLDAPREVAASCDTCRCGSNRECNDSCTYKAETNSGARANVVLTTPVTLAN
ncbi:hypothetical protein KP509_03G058900 [Ceratopteris richardii]|uniref:Metallothionein-like protein n=1 Tax=Ceratopteris richardii TaxID=49495 RepID=A0A8T2V813_CERRI|nr:hypothetical protein KP509_03G058900 [Ceratopteris richardii]